MTAVAVAAAEGRNPGVAFVEAEEDSTARPRRTQNLAEGGIAVAEVRHRDCPSRAELRQVSSEPAGPRGRPTSVVSTLWLWRGRGAGVVRRRWRSGHGWAVAAMQRF